MDSETTIIGIILLLICIVPFLVITKKKATKRRNKLKILTNSVQKMNGAIYQNEFWNHYGIGLDKTNKMLYFSTQSDEENSYEVISLKSSTACSIIKKQDNSNSITGLGLQLDFTDKSKPTVYLPFYERDRNIVLVNELDLIQRWSTTINEQLS
jgi:hypothetical protein